MTEQKVWDPFGTGLKKQAPGSQLARRAELEPALLQWMSEGKTLRAFCREHDVSYRAIYYWRKKDKAFAELFEAAREQGGDAIADECLAIADTPLEADRVTIDEFGLKKVTRGDAVQHRKMQIWTRLQLLAKWFPHKYGDKLQVGGAADLPPVQLSNEERIARIKQLQDRVFNRTEEDDVRRN